MSVRGMIYKCNVCGKKTYKQGNYGIFVREPKDRVPFKKWDLCGNCFRSFIKVIKKQNEEITTKQQEE